MTDFQEKIVKKKFDLEDFLICVVVSLTAIVAILLIEIFFETSYYWFIIWFVAGAIVVKFTRNRLIEWEYSMYASEMSVSKIFSKSKRKMVCNIYFDLCTCFGKLDAFEKYRGNIKKKYTCISDKSNVDEVYFLVFRQSSCEYVLFFEPSESMLKYLKHRFSGIYVE